MRPLRPPQSELADNIVWELVSVRCALARPLDDEVKRSLRELERSLVGALLDMGVLSAKAVAPMPPVTPSAAAPMF
ncbi:MAG TPA: hypothetical protein VLM85_22335 [Polyangiaceae bacterium]|nr:hypothetical protein [Polyangiaceae bacterium]